MFLESTINVLRNDVENKQLFLESVTEEEYDLLVCQLERGDFSLDNVSSAAVGMYSIASADTVLNCPCSTISQALPQTIIASAYKYQNKLLKTE